jgi:2-polyprenyl-6-methoxyphenol hydroxylase-like FAD-dependent oxidoreductase
MPATETQVLIVGGGPVGLALAADLGWRGIACVLVEQGDGTIYHPRANTVNSRTMEFCRRWGVAEEVHNSGAPPDFPSTILYLTSLQGYELARIERPTYGGGDVGRVKPLLTSPERSERCNQLFFDPILRRLAQTLPSVTLRYRCRFETFEEKDGGVIASVRDLASDRVETISARYLVACCAGHSMVPKALDVKWEGEPALSYHLNVFLRTDELWKRHDKGKAAFYFFVNRIGNSPSLIELDGRDLWRLGINLGSERIAPEAVDVKGIVGEVMGPDFPYEVISVLPWTQRSIVADRWQRGPVLLAGDAVHQHGPSGGFGMNTGLGDAVDLGWKLAAALEGWGGSALLDSYERERRPVAKRVVDEVRENQGDVWDKADLEVITEPGARGDAARRHIGDEIVRRRTRVYISDGIALGYRYDPSPIVVPDGTPAPRDSVTDYVQTSRPGSRAPHAWLAEGRSTIDLFGKGFVLLAFGGAAGEGDGLAAAARSRGMPLTVVPIDDAAIAKLYERRLVLVRPDGMVAWRGDAAPADPQALVDRVRGAGRE